MIDRQLKVGDYVFTADGRLARITKINKTTYSYADISKWHTTGNISFDGKRQSYYNGHEEWFYCDNAQAKALELAMKKYTMSEKVIKEVKEVKTLIGKAKYFLNQIEDVEEVEETEEDY